MSFVSLCRQYKLKSCGWILVKFSGPIDFGLLGWFFAFIPNYPALSSCTKVKVKHFYRLIESIFLPWGGPLVSKCLPTRIQLLQIADGYCVVCTNFDLIPHFRNYVWNYRSMYYVCRSNWWTFSSHTDALKYDWRLQKVKGKGLSTCYRAAYIRILVNSSSWSGSWLA